MTTYTLNKKFGYWSTKDEFVDVVVDNPDGFDWKSFIFREGFTPTFQKLTTKISIPEGKTEVKEGAFKDYKHLQKVTLPSSMESIRGGAFKGCTSLSAINIPDKVTRIEEEAFEYTALQSVVIPPSVVFIGQYAFSTAKRVISDDVLDGTNYNPEQTPPTITSISFSSAKTRHDHLNIESSAFANARIAEVTLPPNCTVQAKAFSYCKEFIRVTIPPGCELKPDVFHRSPLSVFSIPISYAFKSVYDGLFPIDYAVEQTSAHDNLSIIRPGFLYMSGPWTATRKVFFTEHIKTDDAGNVDAASLEKAIGFMKCWRGVSGVTYYFSSKPALKIFNQVIEEERRWYTQDKDAFIYIDQNQETGMIYQRYYIPWKNVTARLNYYTSTSDVADNASSDEKKYLNTVFRIMRLGAEERKVLNKEGEKELAPIIDGKPVANDIKSILAINTVHDAILKHITPKTIIMATPVEAVPQESAGGGSKE